MTEAHIFAAIEDLESTISDVEKLAKNALAEGKSAREEVSRVATALKKPIATLKEIDRGRNIVNVRLGNLFDLSARQAAATADLAALVKSKPPREEVEARRELIAHTPMPAVAEVGPRGPAGPKGDKPAHEWQGTSLRFENPDGSWGDAVDLKGEPGAKGKGGGGRFDLSRLPAASDAIPDQFIVLQGGQWVRATYEQLLGWLGGVASREDALLTEDGLLLTTESGDRLILE